MGVDLSTYRARIGCFTNPGHDSLHCWAEASCLLVWMVISQLMLKLAGDVEENPGPKRGHSKKKPKDRKEKAPLTLSVKPSPTEPSKLVGAQADVQHNEHTENLLPVDPRRQTISAADLRSWSVDDVVAWMKKIGIKDEHIEALREVEVDGDLLTSYTVDTLKTDLAEVGHKIPPGPVRKIINARDCMLREHDIVAIPVSQEDGRSHAMSLVASYSDSACANPYAGLVSSKEKIEPTVLAVQEGHNINIYKTGHKHNADVDLEGSQDLKASEMAGSRKKILENFRQFDDKYSHCNYYIGRYFPMGESGADASHVCHEYKLFTEAAKQPQHKKERKYLNEALRFACGCLNERTYGTIHFGVDDDGKIVGFKVAESEKQTYRDCLRNGIEDMFEISLNQQEAALHCIRQPKFVPVVTKTMCSQEFYVMEVDIVPSSVYCKTVMFKVALLNENGDKLDAVAYRRSKAATQSLKGNKKEKEFLKILPKNVESLKKQEQNQSKAAVPSGVSLDRAKELTNILCAGKKTLEGFVHRILVANGPEYPKPSFDEFRDLYDFIVDIPFAAVFDFDAESTTNGLHKVYHSLITEREDSTSNVRILEPDSFSKNIAMTSLDFYQDTNFPKDVCWIMSNGWLDSSTGKKEEPMDLQQWTEARGRGINEAVIKYTDPGINQEGRVLIVFLLLSKSQIGVIAELFHSFCMRLGLESLMVLTPSEQNLEALLNALHHRYKTDDVLRRAVLMPPTHIGLVISRLKGITYGKRCFVNCSTGPKAPLDFSMIKSMKDLEVLSVTQCDYTVEELKKKDRNALKQLKTDSELRFYRGNKVEWWNFYFKQVAERKVYKDLRRYINIASSGTQGRKISVIAIHHQPGAGGSTLAMNALWDVRDTCRCVIIKKSQPDRDTANQLMKLYAYLEDDLQQCLPILALVEDVDEDAFYDFLSALSSVFGPKDTTQPACIVIYCGQTKLASQPKKLHTVHLELKLSVDEQEWFRTKFEQLEDRNIPESSLEDMMSFNLFKEGFNEDYIRRTVSKYLEQVTPKERELISYIALLNVFHVDTSLPVNLCDTFMPGGPQWEQKLSKAANILLMKVQYSKGSIGAYKVKHPKIADETLNQAIEGGQTLSEITENFLKCEMFKERWFTVKNLMEMTDQMFKRRTWKRTSDQAEHTRKKRPSADDSKDEGDEDRETFSGLVQRIITKEDFEAAVRVLQIWHEVKRQLQQRLDPRGYHDDPMIFQQIARIYMYAEKYNDAHHWADEALSLCIKENSYLLDTKGHIYKAEFVAKSNKDTYDPQSVTDIAFKAIKIFRRAQNVNKAETTGFNTAPYFGELFMSFKLFGLVYHSTSRDPDMLRKFLLTGQDPPNFVLEVWGTYTKELRCQVLNIRNTMDYLSEIQTIYKEDGEMGTFDSEFRKLLLAKRKLQRYTEQYIKYFGEYDANPPSYIRHPADICSWRRRKVISLKGNNFREVFEMAKDQEYSTLYEIRSLLSKNEPKTCFDIQNLIAVSLALSRSESPEIAIRSYKEVFRLSEEFVQDQHHDHDISRMKAFFYVTMLMWPRKGMCVEFNLSLFERYLDKLSELGKSPLFYRGSRHGGDFGRASGFQPAKKVYFYLGKGQGLHAFKHVTHFSGDDRERTMLPFWESPQAKELLRRVNGRLFEYDTIHAVNPSNPNKPIRVRLARPERERFVNRKPVNFILGFSWSGPLAFNVLDDHVQEEIPEISEKVIYELEEEEASASGEIDVGSCMGLSDYSRVQERFSPYSDKAASATWRRDLRSSMAPSDYSRAQERFSSHSDKDASSTGGMNLRSSMVPSKYPKVQERSSPYSDKALSSIGEREFLSSMVPSDYSRVQNRFSPYSDKPSSSVGEINLRPCMGLKYSWGHERSSPYSDACRPKDTRHSMPTYREPTRTPPQEESSTNRRIKCPECRHLWNVPSYFKYYHCRNPDCQCKIFINPSSEI
ncbi:sterile alpha motif domain-containing protein 9-like [Branchiostoma floridae x Branchiostoma japonicum]